MNQELILFPVFAQVALTFGIGLWLGKLRFAAVKRGDLNPAYYALNRGGKVPDYLAKVSNNFDNLLAIPVLFYTLAILLLVTERVDISQLVLAWLFTGSRYVHSFIHTTHNNLKHRMRAFLSGIAFLIAMWLLFFLDILQS